MSVYLARTLLLSALISIFVTTCFFLLNKNLLEPLKAKRQKPQDKFKVHFTIQASRTSLTAHDEAFKKAVAQNIRITNKRLDSADFVSEIKMRNDSTYSVSVDQATDTIAIRDLLTMNGKMAFYETYSFGDLLPMRQEFLRDWEPVMKKELPGPILKSLGDDFFKEKKNVMSFLYPAQPIEHQGVSSTFPAFIGFCKVLDTGLVNTYLNAKEILVKFPADIQFMFGEPEKIDLQPDHILYLYAIRKNAGALSNKFISEAQAVLEQSNTPAVAFTFNKAGAEQWSEMTGANIGKPIAICFNDKVKWAPIVSDKIYGGMSRISTAGSFEACRVLAAMLTSEDLLLPVKVIGSNSERIIPKPSTLSRYWLLIVVFIACYTISFCLIWFIFKPGKTLPTKP